MCINSNYLRKLHINRPTFVKYFPNQYYYKKVLCYQNQIESPTLHEISSLKYPNPYKKNANLLIIFGLLLNNP